MLNRHLDTLNNIATLNGAKIVASDNERAFLAVDADQVESVKKQLLLARFVVTGRTRGYLTVRAEG